jgi:two-component system cell cycle sensor histidine kinase PleC
LSLRRRILAVLNDKATKPARSRAARDMLAVALFSLAVFLLCAALDVNEQLMEWLLAHDHLHLHELPLIVMATAIGLGWFAARRWREYKEELRRRRALEQRLRVAANAAELGNRAKSEFLATMSHELRTPLNAIIGFSEALGGGYFGDLTPRQSTYVKDIQGAGEHLLQIINNILDMSKLDAGRMTLSEERVDVKEVVEEAMRLVHQRAQKANIALTVEPIAPGLQLRADALRLRQILLNLVTNAVKFTPARGKVTVRAGRRRDGSFAIEVADTGIGMRPGDIEVALTPFAQVENIMTRRQEGTGLGLPIVKALAELHGGSLQLESQPGVGTTATVILPGARVMAPAEAAATQAA